MTVPLFVAFTLIARARWETDQEPGHRHQPMTGIDGIPGRDCATRGLR
jgi:hypothetical protein